MVYETTPPENSSEPDHTANVRNVVASAESMHGMGTTFASEIATLGRALLHLGGSPGPTSGDSADSDRDSGRDSDRDSGLEAHLDRTTQLLSERMDGLASVSSVEALATRLAKLESELGVEHERGHLEAGAVPEGARDDATRPTGDAAYVSGA